MSSGVGHLRAVILMIPGKWGKWDQSDFRRGQRKGNPILAFYRLN